MGPGPLEERRGGFAAANGGQLQHSLHGHLRQEQLVIQSQSLTSLQARMEDVADAEAHVLLAQETWHLECQTTGLEGQLKKAHWGASFGQGVAPGRVTQPERGGVRQHTELATSKAKAGGHSHPGS